MSFQFIRTVLILLASLVLFACGGGSSSSTPPVVVPPPQGPITFHCSKDATCPEVTIIGDPHSDLNGMPDPLPSCVLSMTCRWRHIPTPDLLGDNSAVWGKFAAISVCIQRRKLPCDVLPGRRWDGSANGPGAHRVATTNGDRL